MMKLSDIQDLIFPGYHLLTNRDDTNFLNSEAGKVFQKFVEEQFNEYKKKSEGFLNYLTSYVKDPKTEWLKEFEIAKKNFFSSIKEQDGYDSILAKLTAKFLVQEFLGFEFLSQNDKDQLSQHTASQALYLEVSEINRSIQDLSSKKEMYEQTFVITNEEDHEENLLLEIKKKKIQLWKKTISENPVHKEIIKQLNKKIIEKYVAELLEIFPLLSYYQDSSKISLAKILQNHLLNKNNATDIEWNRQSLREMAEGFLKDILFKMFSAHNRAALKNINFDKLNQDITNDIVTQVFEAFNQEKIVNLTNCLKNYETRFFNHISLELLDGKKFDDSGLGISNGLSFYWKQFCENKKTQEFAEWVNSYTGAYAFIQATGFSAQNENSLLGIMDLYHYGRFHKQITEAKNILWGIVRLLAPLYHEYKDIGLHEKNTLRKVVRILVPIVIVVAVVVLVSVFMAPLIQAAAAAVAVCILSVIIGIALATLYTAVKNSLYQYAREKYHGGPFEIPEFQVNPRMNTIFQEKAAEIRDFYIKELSSCDSKEQFYQGKLKNLSCLSESEKSMQKENMERRNKLALEWYDIHSNIKVTQEEAKTIVSTRLKEECQNTFSKLKNDFNEEAQKDLKEQTQLIAKDIKEQLIKANSTPEQNLEDRKLVLNYQPQMFKPAKYWEHKQAIEHLEALSPKI